MTPAQYCPACAEEVVPNMGSAECDFIVVEEFPDMILPEPAIQGWMKNRRPEWTPRKILENELGKLGMVIQQFRIISVFPHLPPADGMPNENCYQAGLERARNEMEGKQGIIVLGDNLCKEMTRYNLKGVHGLTGVDFLLGWDAGDQPRMFIDHPRKVLLPKHPGIGEIRIGLERFARLIGVN
jgi:hypothetical protein